MYYSLLMRLFFYLYRITKRYPILKNIINILIVDDNINFIKRMISILDDVKYPKNISVASGYNDAISELAHVTPDIILLDINMPGKNGIEVLRHIYEHQSGADVIMLTNHADAFYKEQCRELGARYFLDKSNDFLQVSEIVDAYCKENIEKSQTE